MLLAWFHPLQTIAPQLPIEIRFATVLPGIQRRTSYLPITGPDQVRFFLKNFLQGPNCGDQYAQLTDQGFFISHTSGAGKRDRPADRSVNEAEKDTSPLVLSGISQIGRAHV